MNRYCKATVFLLLEVLGTNAFSQMRTPCIYELPPDRLPYNIARKELECSSDSKVWHVYSDRDFNPSFEDSMQGRRRTYLDFARQLAVIENSDRSLHIAIDTILRTQYDITDVYTMLRRCDYCNFGWIDRSRVLLSNRCIYENFSSKKALTIPKNTSSSSGSMTRVKGYKGPDAGAQLAKQYAPFTLCYVYKQVGSRCLVSEEEKFEDKNRPYTPQMAWIEKDDLYTWNSNLYVSVNDDSVAQVEMSTQNLSVPFFKRYQDAVNWEKESTDTSSFISLRYYDTSNINSILKPILLDIDQYDSNIIKVIGVDPFIIDSGFQKYNDPLRLARRQIALAFVVDFDDFFNSTIIDEAIDNILSSKLISKQFANAIKFSCVVYFSSCTDKPCLVTDSFRNAKNMKDWLRQRRQAAKNFSDNVNCSSYNFFLGVSRAADMFQSDKQTNIIVMVGSKQDSSKIHIPYKQNAIEQIAAKNVNMIGVQPCTNGDVYHNNYVTDMMQLVIGAAKRQMDMFHMVFRAYRTYDNRLEDVADGSKLENAGFEATLKYKARVFGSTCLSAVSIKDEILNLIASAAKSNDISYERQKKMRSFVSKQDTSSIKMYSWQYALVHFDSNYLKSISRQLDSARSQFITPLFTSMRALGDSSPIFRRYILLSPNSYSYLMNSIDRLIHPGRSHHTLKEDVQSIIFDIGICFMGGDDDVPSNIKKMSIDKLNENVQKIKLYNENYKRLLKDIVAKSTRMNWDKLAEFYRHAHSYLEKIPLIDVYKFSNGSKFGYWIPEDILVPPYN